MAPTVAGAAAAARAANAGAGNVGRRVGQSARSSRKRRSRLSLRPPREPSSTTVRTLTAGIMRTVESSRRSSNRLHELIPSVINKSPRFQNIRIGVEEVGGPITFRVPHCAEQIFPRAKVSLETKPAGEGDDCYPGEVLLQCVHRRTSDL
mmetsp:Transcript_54589/g.144249  ORF Transcript_54589/g.144249 Transcript_54589/m.144249 type:complete len:150 (+) Transcript_54589:111-560(+)